jgi:hypothetical protein
MSRRDRWVLLAALTMGAVGFAAMYLALRWVGGILLALLLTS